MSNSGQLVIERFSARFGYCFENSARLSNRDYLVGVAMEAPEVDGFELGCGCGLPAVAYRHDRAPAIWMRGGKHLLYAGIVSHGQTWQFAARKEIFSMVFGRIDTSECPGDRRLFNTSVQAWLVDLGWCWASTWLRPRPR